MPADPPHSGPPTGPVQPADSFGLAFEVMAPIALGATARVDLCRCLSNSNAGARAGQVIAIKRPLSELIGEEQVARRFLDEVWMSAALRHPNVVQVIGWGRDQEGPYLGLELVCGVSLARLMKSVFDTREQFSERLVVYLGQLVAGGLAAAHELRSERGEFLQLVHRDLSAANILVSFAGQVKIADFGLAKAKDRLTVTTSELPTRNMTHISPEELTQRPVDHRSDLFSFGVLLFELLAGRAPFAGRDDLATLKAVLESAPLALDDLRPKLDRGLCSLIMRCLEKDPARRPASAREIEAFLAEWLNLHGYTADSEAVLSRFVRRNSMRQMRWFERVLAGEPEPAPLPFNAPKPSFYDLGNEGRANAAATAASDTRQRDAEPTAVERRPGRPPPPRRPLPSESLMSGQRTRRVVDNPSSDGETPMFVEGETDEDIPTLALKVDSAIAAHYRQSLMQPRPEVGIRGPMQTAFLHDPSPAAATPLPSVPRALQRIERELADLRTHAGNKHERARAARESARLAVLEAERAEHDARLVERAIATARQSLDIASRGQVEEAIRKLEDALATLRSG